jgi:hypothetical protein
VQPAYVMAFRKRMKKRGYKNITIKYRKDKKMYVVSGDEPLSGCRVIRECGYDFICNGFRF